MQIYHFESGYYDQGVRLCALAFWALWLLFVVALALASGVLVVFEDSSWVIRLGSFILSGCFPGGLCSI